MNKKHRAASDVLEGVLRGNNADYISFQELNYALHERGFGLLMLFFSLPLAIPFPAPPGFTLIPSIPLLLFSIQMLRGMEAPWLPAWVGNKKIKRKTVALIVEKTAPYLKKMERLMRPRLSFASSKGGEKIVGLFALIFSLSIMIPLPLTNLIPAIGILLMSLGLLSRDGVPIILGMAVGTFGVTLTILIIILGKKAAIGIIHGMFS